MWAEVNGGSGKLGRSGGGLWATLIDSPNEWVYYPNMSGAAVNTVKAAGALKPDLSLFGDTRLLPSGDLQMQNLTIQDNSESFDGVSGHVNNILFLSGANLNQFAFASVEGTPAGLLITVEQATVATTALIQDKAISYEAGDIFYYNTSSGEIEQLDNVLTLVTMTN